MTNKLETTIKRLLEHGWTVVFYDGQCIACSRTVRYIAAHSPHSRLAFCAAESSVGQRVLARMNLAAHIDQTLIAVESDAQWTGTDAIARVSRHMDGNWRLLGRALEWCPRVLREPCYRWFARNRYRIAGRSEHCELPVGELRRRFIQ